MKKIFNIHTVIIFVILIAGLTAFGNSEFTQQEDQLIQGTWIVQEDPNNKWVITSSEVEWIINGNIFKRFNYTISSETSPNGIVHKFLDLVEINKLNSTYSYNINSLGPNKMTLETTEPKVTYIHFCKQ